MAERWRLEGIPGPSGNYEVGCTHLMHQDLHLRLYYPTEKDLATKIEYAKYLPHPNYLKAFLDIVDVPLSSILPEVQQMYSLPRTPALLNSPLIQCSSKHFFSANKYITKGFPVVVFSHGLSGHFFAYSGICSDLASHGYVVAAVEHKDGSALLALKRVPGPGVQVGQYDQYVDEWIPNNEVMPISDNQMGNAGFPLRNKQIRQRAKEVRQALDILHLLNEGGDVHDMLGGHFDFTQFKGCLNMELAAVAGHSFGGGTVVQVLSEDPRFRCGIALDTWMYPLHRDIYKHGIHQPLTFINSFDFHWDENITCMMKLVKPTSKSGLSDCTIYTIIGSTHFSQTDVPFIPILGALKKLTNSPLDKYMAHKVNMELCHAFLKRFLIQDPSYCGYVPILDGGEGASEHILYGTNINWKEENNTDEMHSEPTRPKDAHILKSQL